LFNYMRFFQISSEGSNPFARSTFYWGFSIVLSFYDKFMTMGHGKAPIFSR